MMKLTYFGHSCFSAEINGARLLFDPFITPNSLASRIDANTVEADYILISHGHSDHIADAVSIARRTGARVISNFEIIEWLGRQGITNATAMNHGGSASFDFGRVKYVSAIHSSSLPDGAYGGNPGGFVVETDSGDFYYSGDTALTRDMELIGEAYTLRFAVLCIGDTFTMGVGDAIKACAMIGCEHVMGVHYDTFPPIRIDHAEAVRRFAEAGRDLRLVEIGGSIEF